ncbi:hypothetical protein FDECE_131 [Fusarium decemcellulare]|nr:hypothetical protein FDECE_131 [Fusarium decemcellulare]
MDEIRPGLNSKRDGTALTTAARGGFVDVVKMLIADARVEIDYKDQFGRTALSYAAERGDEDVVAELLATGAVDLNSHGDWERTPLICAVHPKGGYGPGGWQSYEGVIRRLLANGQTDVNSKDLQGYTALCYAAEEGTLGLVVALLQHPEIDPTAGPGHTTPLAEAAKFGHVDVVQALLNTGRVDVNTVMTGTAERTALMEICEFGHHEKGVQVLLSIAGIDVNFKDRWGNTSLMLAASRGKADMVKLLLASGGDPNTQDYKGNTALCRASDTEVTRALVGAPDVKPDLPNNVGRTALSLAAEAGEIERVNVLLAADGVNPDARDARGRSPLSWVFGEDGLHGGWKKEERKAVVRQLLQIPAVDPNAVDQDRNRLTPLLRAIRSDHSNEYVEILLSRPDLDVNQPRDWGGNTPLDVAKEAGNMDTVALLRARGAAESDRSMGFQWFNVNSAASEEDSPAEESSASEEDFWQRKALRLRKTLRLKITLRLRNTLGLLTRRQQPPPRRASRSPSRSPSQSSHSSSEGYEPNFNSYRKVTESLENELRQNLLREYHLRLREQPAYVNEWTDSTEKMCSMCSTIDLNSAFWTRHTQYGGRVIADLGRVDETWNQRTCPLCLLFAAVHPRTSLQEGHKLVSFSTTQSWLCHDQMLCWSDFRYKPLGDTMVLAVVADSMVADAVVPTQHSPTRRDRNAVKAAFCSGLISRLGSNGSPVTIPRLAAEISDWSAARGWITWCRENHPRECNPRRVAAVPHFFLIDCSKRRIVEHKQSGAGRPPQYVALSYVWGQPLPGRQPPQRQQQQQSLGEKGSGAVEAVVEDAISASLKLGYQYLWVDRYCVVQTGNEAVKQKQLQHMHLVYANAEVTLIAAAGNGASAGLPGLPGRPRRQQPDALIQGHAVVCIPPDPSLHIRSGSTWATRGWTYQEGLLARRRLYLSEHEMSYECCHMLCREAMRLSPDVEQSMSAYKPRLMEPFWMYEPYRVPGMDTYHTGIGLFDLLAVYSTRKLSLPSDTLNAMLGILNLLAQHKKRPIYHLCGVPILRFDDIDFDSNSDTEVTAPAALGGFLNGLCWRLQEPTHRQPGFPSWSWTGWQGMVTSMSNRDQPIEQTHGFGINVSIIPRNQDSGAAVSWSRCYNQLRMADDSNLDIRSGQQHVLEITASAVTVRFRKGEYERRPDRWIGTVCAGDDVWQGEFFLTRKDEGDDDKLLLLSLLREPWTGIVLGNSQNQQYLDTHDTTVLVVQEQEQKQQHGEGQEHMYCERIGLLSLMHCTLNGNMLERRTWRLQ